MQKRMMPISDEFMMMTQETPSNTLPQLIQKLLEGSEPTDIQLQQLSDAQLAIYMKTKEKKQNNLTKRPDQLQKMFYKRAIKYAEEIFFQKKKNKRINLFYKYHFAEIAEKMGCSLLNFYHPNKQIKSGKKTGQKTFNMTYIKLILHSASFRAVSREYLEIFMQQNFRERKQKIQKLIESCWKIINKTDPNQMNDIKIQNQYLRESQDQLSQLNYLNIFKETQQRNIQTDAHKQRSQKYVKREIQSFQELNTYFMSSKCKIPWSNKELEEAKKSAYRDLEITYDNLELI